jgi:hypothetical protein
MTIQFIDLVYLKKPQDVSINVALEFESLADMVFLYKKKSKKIKE